MSTSAFGIDHGDEVAKSLGMPKGMLKAKGKGGYDTNYVANRKMAKFTGKLIARNDARKGGKGRSVFPHAGERYRGKSREILATQNNKKPNRRLP